MSRCFTRSFCCRGRDGAETEHCPRSEEKRQVDEHQIDSCSKVSLEILEM